jgi:addiction module HigA family antidote
MEEYQLNPFSLSKKIGLSSSAVRQIVIGKSRITVPVALRLAKVFGQPASFWHDLQLQADLQQAAQDTKLQDILKTITKAAKPAPAKTKGKAAAKPAKKTAQPQK